MIDLNIEIKKDSIKEKVRCYNSEDIDSVLNKFNVSKNTVLIIKKLGIKNAGDLKAMSLNRIEFYDILGDIDIELSKEVSMNLFKIMQMIGSKMDLQRTLRSF